MRTAIKHEHFRNYYISHLHRFSLKIKFGVLHGNYYQNVFNDIYHVYYFQMLPIRQLHLAVAVLVLHTSYILTKNGLQYGWFHGNCLKFSGESFFRVPRVTNIFMNSGSIFNIWMVDNNLWYLIKENIIQNSNISQNSQENFRLVVLINFKK